MELSDKYFHPGHPKTDNGIFHIVVFILKPLKIHNRIFQIILISLEMAMESSELPFSS